MSAAPVTTAPEPLLRVDRLTVDFRTPRGPVHALRGVSLSVPRRRIVGIVGESGSGKSTLVWAVTRLLANNAVVKGGGIRFAGADVLALDEKALEAFRGRQVSVVFQDPMTSQIPVLSYARQMLDVQHRQRARPRPEKRRRAVESIRRVGIPDPEERLDQYPHQFSGGMRQRAAVAMSLLMEPLLVFLDEPTTALDVTMEAQIIALLRELNADFEATLVLVSHNLGLVAELCDVVVVMYAGEVVERGSVEQIFHDPRHPYTRALLECDPARQRRATRRLPVIPGEVPDLHRRPPGCGFAPRCAHAAAVCTERAPALVEVETGEEDRGGHAARCHLLDSLAPRPSLRSPPDDRGGEEEGGGAAPSGLRANPGETDLNREGVRPRPEKTRAEPPILEVRGLRVRFRVAGVVKAAVRRIADPHVDAVLDAGLTLGRGETLGLVGESGSGKTTLGRAILGLVPSTRGSVRIDGREVSALREAEWRPLRRELAMMFQDPNGSLSPRKSVRSLLAEPFRIHRAADGGAGRGGGDPALRRGVSIPRLGEGEIEGELLRLCDMVRLPAGLLDRYPHELSGGQARRVGVARALALRPRLIVADEPTAGLDVSVQGEILNLLAELQRAQGLSYLLISHNLPVVRHVSDRLAIMYLGRIVEQGPSALIFGRPAHPYTDALVRGIPRPDPAKRIYKAPIEGEIPSLRNRPAGCEFHTRCPHVREKCRNDPPAARPLPDGREVRCHFPLAE